MSQFNRRRFNQLLTATLVSPFVGGARADNGGSASLPAYSGSWKPLLNGRDLSGWSFFQEGVGTTDTTNAVVYKDGVVQVLGPSYRGSDTPGFGHIATVDEYANYHLRFQFKFGKRRFEPRLLAKRNSGLLYHMFPQRDRVWPNSVEFQLEESDVGDAILINSRCWPGNDVGGTPAWPGQVPILPPPEFPPPREPRPPLERQRVLKNGDFERLEEWNTIELITIGDKAAHLVNGRIVTTLFNLVAQDTNNRNVYRPLTSGRIGLEIECAEAYFRDVEIRQFDVSA